METKKLFSILLVILLLVMSAGCAGNGEKPQASDKEAAGEPVTPDKKVPDITDLYLLTRHEDFTYSFSLSDYDGNILFEQVNYHREPKLNQIAPTVYEIIVQTGTGLSTNWAVYCDVENSKASDIYSYVLAAKDNYVICGDYKDGEHLIIVREIFTQEGAGYCQEYKLENASPSAADFAVGCTFDDQGNAVVTYLAGEEFRETEMTITLP